MPRENSSWSGDKKINLSGMMSSYDQRNFTVHLEGGVLTTKTGFLTNKFSAEVKLDNRQGELLAKHLLSTYNYYTNHESRYDRHDKTTLSLGVNVTTNGQTVQYQVNVKPVESYEDSYGEKKVVNFVLLPVLPEQLQQGQKGVRVNGHETREGIDPTMNQQALTWARAMHKEFGLQYSKLDAECVKSVCVEPTQITEGQVLAMLQRSNASIRLRQTFDNYREEVLGAVSITYGKNSLSISGSIKSGGERVISTAASALFAAEAFPDKTQKVVFEQHYDSTMANRISEAIHSFGGGVKSVVSFPFTPLFTVLERRETKQTEKAMLIRQGLRENLEPVGVLKKDTETKKLEGGVCVIQYDPQCFIKEKRPEQQPATATATN